MKFILFLILTLLTINLLKAERCKSNTENACYHMTRQEQFCNMTLSLCENHIVRKLNETCDRENKCEAGLFCINSYCRKVHGPGSTITVSGSQQEYHVCINSRRNVTADEIKCLVYDEVKTAELNEDCGYSASDGPNCVAPYFCVNGKCRAAAKEGERCHTGHTSVTYPVCVYPFVCNLGYCVKAGSLGKGSNADNRYACDNIRVTNISQCHENCTVGHIDYQLYKGCNYEHKWVDFYSLDEHQLAVDSILCKSGRTSNNRCVPISKDLCYNNEDCYMTGGSYCYDPKWNEKIPGKCVNTYAHYAKLYMKSAKARDEKDKETVNKTYTDIIKHEIKLICTQYCFSTHPTERLYGSVTSLTVNTNYTYNCVEGTRSLIKEAGEFKGQFTGCADFAKEEFSAAPFMVPSLFILLVFVFLYLNF